MLIKTTSITDKKVWENFLLSQTAQANFLQSWNWGQTHQVLGKSIFRFGFWQDKKLVGIALLIKQTARRGTYFECPAGPILDWNSVSQVTQIFAEIKKIAYSEKCLFVRIRPQIENSSINKNLFKQHGFYPAPMHLHAQDTWVLNISPKEEEILKNMRKSTRYLIRKAVRDGVEIIQSKNQEDIKILYKLQDFTSKRHNFVPFSYKFFLAHFQAFIADDQIKIFKAIYQKKVTAIALIVFYAGRAVYHYSASDPQFLKIPSSYLLQWEAIKEAKKRNCRLYDFWGISINNNPKHRFAGVTLFKKGFGGFPISYLPAQDLPLRWKYWLVYFFETCRRFRRNL